MRRELTGDEQMLKVRVAFVDGQSEKFLPMRATEGSAGYDLFSRETLTLAPGDFCKVATGVILEIPAGYEAQVRPRSGLAAKYGVTLLNSPDTIDSDYRGEVCAILINHGKDPFKIEVGMRIAQLIFAEAKTADFEVIDTVSGTERGAGGFGSTGIRTMNT